MWRVGAWPEKPARHSPFRYDLGRGRSRLYGTLNGKRLRAAFEDDPALGYLLVTRFAAVMGERLRAAHMRMLELEDQP